MGAQTSIAWTDHTFNPWWGCERVSPGCQNCYAEQFDKRVGGDHWGKNADRRMMSDAHWRQPLKWDRAAAEAGRSALVFCSSMADVFEDRPELEEQRARLWELIEQTPHLIWQLLTKRPQNVVKLVPRGWVDCFPIARAAELGLWPSNVWIGTTVEDQQRAAERVPVVAAMPSPVRFLSVEPMLGPVSIEQWLLTGPPVYFSQDPPWIDFGRPWIDWVICGAESGPKRRPFDLDHARALRDQCVRAGVPFFFKQGGGLHSGAPGPDDLEAFKQFPRGVGRPS